MITHLAEIVKRRILYLSEFIVVLECRWIVVLIVCKRELEVPIRPYRVWLIAGC